MLIPDQETAVDFLNYEAVAKTVVALLKENREHALTIGIHGDWGAGKSSVLKMVESGMHDDKKVACLWFNGWTFQGFDDAKTVLIEVIVSELIRQRSTYGKVKEKGLKLLKRVKVMKLARHGVGLAVSLKAGILAAIYGDGTRWTSPPRGKRRSDVSKRHQGQDRRGGRHSEARGRRKCPRRDSSLQGGICKAPRRGTDRPARRADRRS